MANIIHTWNTQALWQGGSSLSNIDTTTTPNSILYADAGTASTWNNALTGWTLQDTVGAAATLTSTGTGLVVGGTGSNYFAFYQTNGVQFGNTIIGDWVIPYTKTNENQFQIAFMMGFLVTTGSPAHLSYRNGYYVELFNSNISLVEAFLGGSTTVLASAAVPATSGAHTVRIHRSSTGFFQVYLDGVVRLTATNNDFNSSNSGTYFGYATSKSAGNTITLYANGQGPANFTTPSGSVVGSWQSDAVNFGSTVTRQWAPFTFSQTLNSGTTQYFTRSGPNGSTWDAWVAVTGGVVGSTVQAWGEARVDITTTSGEPVVASISFGTKTSVKKTSSFFV